MRAQTDGVAAFDFDGTLIRGDSLSRFLAFLLGRPGFARVLITAAPAMIAGFRRSGRDGAKSALLARAVTGRAASDVGAAGRAFAATLDRRVRPDMSERLSWHDGQGHRRVLVSASLADYLEPFGARHGFDRVIATRLEVGPDGRLTGRLDGPNVRAAEKAQRLTDLLGPGEVELWAYGDSRGDREMLAMADHPTRVGGRGRRRESS